MEEKKTLSTLKDLQPDNNNANRGNVRGSKLLRESLEFYGAGRSVLADRKGTLIAGNKTVEQAKEMGLNIRVVETTGNELVVVQRTDLDLTDRSDLRAKGLAIADNRVGEVSLTWDAREIEESLQSLGEMGVGLWTEKEKRTLSDLATLQDLDNLAGSAASLGKSHPQPMLMEADTSTNQVPETASAQVQVSTALGKGSKPTTVVNSGVSSQPGPQSGQSQQPEQRQSGQQVVAETKQQQWVNLSFPMVVEQRTYLQKTLGKYRQEWGLNSNTEVLIRLCEQMESQESSDVQESEVKEDG